MIGLSDELNNIDSYNNQELIFMGQPVISPLRVR
jgi:hypothetical protein